jgi:hypothetical protein
VLPPSCGILSSGSAPKHRRADDSLIRVLPDVSAHCPTHSCRHVSDHVAIWADAGIPATFAAGRVAVDASGIRLDGRGSDGIVARTVSRSDIVSVQRERSAIRRGGQAWLRLELRSGDSVLLTTVFGIGTFSELLDAIQSLLT